MFVVWVRVYARRRWQIKLIWIVMRSCEVAALGCLPAQVSTAPDRAQQGSAGLSSATSASVSASVPFALLEKQKALYRHSKVASKSYSVPAKQKAQSLF